MFDERTFTVDKYPNSFIFGAGAKVSVGEYMWINSNTYKNKKRRYRKGTVVQTTDRYIIVSFGKYLECINKSSILTGDVEILLRV